MNARGEGWVLGQVLLGAAFVFVPRFAGRIGWPLRIPLILLAAPLLIVGGIFSGYGIAALGKDLTVFPKPNDDSSLKNEGIYACVRHPIYGGLIMAAAGIALATGNIGRVLLTVGAFFFFDSKSAVEERWLAELHPDYAEYRQKVRKLLPGIY